jgi:hypothetical protein
MGKIGVVDFILIVIPMLIVAMILDVAGIILFVLSLVGVGIPFSFILDIIGAVVIGGFLYLLNRSTAGIGKGLYPVLRRLMPRLGLSFLVESIPFVGDIMPSWTILVAIEFINTIMA